jgi:hypothetical protein
VAADGGAPAPLTDFETGHIWDVKWTSDEKSVVFTYGAESTDIVLIRDFM